MKDKSAAQNRSITCESLKERDSKEMWERRKRDRREERKRDSRGEKRRVYAEKN